MCNSGVCRRQLSAREKKISTRPRWDLEGEAMADCRDIQFPSVSSPGRSVTNQPSWYAIQTRSRHELRISTELMQKGIHAFTPTLRESHRWSDRTKVLEVPLFSCYVFVHLVDSPAMRLEVLKTAGVFR